METKMLGLIGQFGIVPTMILLCMVIWFLLREIKKEVRGLKNQMSGLRAEMGTRIEKIEDRLEYVEKEYFSKEDHYREMGGWRQEIQDLRLLIMKASA